MDNQHSSGPPTIVTVAQEAGVHPSTVSRALSDDPRIRGGVAAPTRDKVAEVARRLAYRRNRVGASLRTGRTGVIGVLVPRITDIVVALAYEGLDAEARARGYVTLVGNTLDDPRTRKERIDQLFDYGVDAIMFSDGHLDDEPPAGSYPVPVLPFMRSSGHQAGVSAVDDADGGAQAAQHLLGLGHRNIAVVAGPTSVSTARDRTRGFIEELDACGINIASDRIAKSTFDVASGKAAAARLLAQGLAPTAVFAVNDFAAIGVMAAARSQGLSVPGDISVVGFNDIPMAGELPIPLTTVRSPLRDAGAAAAQVAVAAIGGETLAHTLLATHLIVRESTAPP